MDIYWAAKRQKKGEELFYYKLKQRDKRAQKDDYNSFILATITINLDANPARVAREWIAVDIQSLRSQSERVISVIVLNESRKVSHLTTVSEDFS